MSKGLLTSEERGNLFRAYYSCEIVDITKISWEEYLCQAQLDKSQQEKIEPQSLTGHVRRDKEHPVSEHRGQIHNSHAVLPEV